MIQIILFALFCAGLAYLGVGFIGLAFLSLREKKYSVGDNQKRIPG